MKKRLMVLVLTLVTCLSISIPVCAANEYDSDPVVFTFEGKTYEVWSTLFEDGTRYRAATWIKTANNTNIPANGAQVQSFLVDDSGQVAQSSLSMLTDAYYFHVAYTSYRSASTGVHANGVAYIKNSSGNFKRFESDDTEKINMARALASENGVLTVDGKYPENINGETYGSLMLAETVGAEPELISAIGTEGQSGYVRFVDLFANYDTTRAGGRYITLYDIDGADIGNFKIEFNDMSEISGKDIDTVRSELADGRSEDPTLWAIADETLIDGEYPVNSHGETYGHPSLRSLVGYEPDLIQAVNDKGIFGYVRRSDSVSAIINAATTPLYDKEGQVIGEFLVDNCDVESENKTSIMAVYDALK